MAEKEPKIIARPTEVLFHYWGYRSFRPLQGDIIHHLLEGNDTLAIMPTGGGKSICFQVPGLLFTGVCLVISPLIALMKDQVSQLQHRGIRAAAIYSGMRMAEITSLLNSAIDGELDFLYISPERLKTNALQQALKHLKIGLLAIDEAHCISKWGHDFRPAYLEISALRAWTAHQQYPVIALTATATQQVRQEIIERLQLKGAKIFLQSFARENLSYCVVYSDQKELDLLSFLRAHTGASIVYVRTRKRTLEIAGFLQKRGIKADYYHAGLPLDQRNQKQDQWIRGNYTIVTTNAFGMGIDKPDVRAVVHLDLCDNLEAYYQESGRAGRDGNPCCALILFNQNDLIQAEKALEMKYPPYSVLQKIYQFLANYFQVPLGEVEVSSYDFDLYRFASTFGLGVLETHHALKALETQNLIYLSDAYHQPSRVQLRYKGNSLLEYQERNSRLGPVIKALLRIYGGELYTSWVDIREEELGSAIGGSFIQIQACLTELHQQGVVEYLPQKNAPQLGFIGYRYDAAQLPINHKAMTERKSNDQRAWKAMAFYATQKRLCRMNTIQEYFDEKDAKPCGKCDVCVAKNASPPSESMGPLIIASLPATVEELQQKFVDIDKQVLVQFIQKELARGALGMDRYGLIFVAS